MKYLAEYSYNEQQDRVYLLIALTALERCEQLTKLVLILYKEFFNILQQYI